jgi:hypothetical protein
MDNNLIYTPSGLVVDSINPFFNSSAIGAVDWLIDKMTLSLGSLSDDSSIQKALTINRLAVNCIDDDFESVDCYLDAVAEYAEIDPYVFLPL